MSRKFWKKALLQRAVHIIHRPPPGSRHQSVSLVSLCLPYSIDLLHSRKLLIRSEIEIHKHFLLAANLAANFVLGFAVTIDTNDFLASSRIVSSLVAVCHTLGGLGSVRGMAPCMCPKSQLGLLQPLRLWPSPHLQCLRASLPCTGSTKNLSTLVDAHQVSFKWL